MINQKKWGAFLSYLSLIVNVVVKLLYTPLLLRLLGQAEYGLYSLVLSIVGYLAILDFGFGSTVTRYTVQFKSACNRERLLSLYGTFSLIYIGIGILAFIVCFLISQFSIQIFSNSMTSDEIFKIRIMLLLCGINLLFSFPLQISSSVISAYEKFVFKNGINFAKIIAEPVVTILLLYFFNAKSVTAVMVITLCNLLGYFLYYIYAYHKLDFKFSLKHFDVSLIKILISYSASMFMLMLFEQLQFNSGQFVLGVFYGSKMVAVWGIVMIFVLNYRAISTSITNVYLPSFLHLVFENNRNGLLVTIIRMSRFQAFVLLIILFNFILFGSPFISIWAGADYSEAYFCSLIIMIPMTIGLLLEYCYMYQMARKELKYRIVTFFLCFIISFIITYLFCGITLRSFSYILALSILSGQVVFVLLYLNRSEIKNVMLTWITQVIKCFLLPAVLTLVCFFVFHTLSLDNNRLYTFVIELVLYNGLLFITLYFGVLNKEEKKLLHRA